MQAKCNPLAIMPFVKLPTSNGDLRNDHEAYFSAGLTWCPRDQLQFDDGVCIGLTDDSTDFTPSVGVSTKF